MNINLVLFKNKQTLQKSPNPLESDGAQGGKAVEKKWKKKNKPKTLLFIVGSFSQVLAKNQKSK